MGDRRLAASAEMLFLGHPFEDRVRRIHERGFLVEIWNWTAKDLPAIRATGASINSMTGYIEGDLLEPDGIERLIETARRSLDAAEQLGCPNLNLHGTGLDQEGQAIRKKTSTSDDDVLRAADTLRQLARLAEERGRVFTLENLNLLVDHPGTPFATAAETMRLVREVDSPALRMNLDLYHAQIGEGNLIELVTEAMPWIGEIQVADVPGRQEPGTGEINYTNIAKSLDELNYSGVVGLEGWASVDSHVALDAFQEAFSPWVNGGTH